MREGETPWLLLVSTVLLTVFGGITIALGGTCVAKGEADGCIPALCWHFWPSVGS